MRSWVRRSGGGCTVEVRVTPRSGRAGVEMAPGGPRVRVHAPPEGGRATREAARLLAEALEVAPSRVTLRTGAASRTKVFTVAGVSPEDARRLLGGS